MPLLSLGYCPNGCGAGSLFKRFYLWNSAMFLQNSFPVQAVANKSVETGRISDGVRQLK